MSSRNEEVLLADPNTSGPLLVHRLVAPAVPRHKLLAAATPFELILCETMEHPRTKKVVPH